MDGFMNVLKRFSLSTNYSKWSPAFSRMVHQVSARNVGPNGNSASTISLHDRIALLRKLDPYIKQPCFTNTDDMEILQAKEDLLALWEYLLEFVVVMSKPAVKELGYALIVLLMQREEFTLKKLGFGPKSQGPRCSQAHLRLAKKYKVLLLQTFMLVMKSMTAKGKFAEIIHFSAQTLVVFFFRLPLVGGRIIDALEKKSIAQKEAMALEEVKDQQVSDSANMFEDDEDGTASAAAAATTSSSDNMMMDEAKPSNSENIADEDTTMVEEAKRIAKKGLISREVSEFDSKATEFIMNNPDLFQWNYFNSETEAAALGPKVLGDDNACLQWLSNKETFFLTFVEVFVVHVESVAKPVMWDVIPAYKLILDCFWPLLKSSMWWDGICKRKVGEGRGWVTSLPAYMRVKRSALALLSNKKLVNDFIRLTYESTNVHSLLSVDSCVEHLNLWFSTVAYAGSAREGIVNHNQNSRNVPPKQTLVEDIKKNNQPDRPCLPDSFDYDNFWFGMSHLLESDLFQVLLKVCSFLYNTFHLFRGQLRVRFVGDLMNQYFFRLFLHWSSEVRTYFQLTLVYKVLRADRRNLPCFTDAQVIREYGTNGKHQNAGRPILQRRFSFGEGKGGGGSGRQEDVKVPPNVYSGEGSFERRMAIFDDLNSTDNEMLLIDIMHCSKIDSYIRMCLEKDPSIPEDRRIYIEPSLRQYAVLLEQYYRGVTLDSNESLPLLAHRMVYSDSNPYM